MDLVKKNKEGQYEIQQEPFDNLIEVLRTDFKTPLCIGTMKTKMVSLGKLKKGATFTCKTKQEADIKAKAHIKSLTQVAILELNQIGQCIDCKSFEICRIMTTIQTMKGGNNG